MAKHTGFMTYKREDPPKRPVPNRITDFKEFEQFLPINHLNEQVSRCMDCGIPYCHAFGCPVKNRIPDWNEMVFRGQWRKALDLLLSTNNFPEITGRICPATCEAACTLSIDQEAVTIRHIELQIVERGWQEGWIQPEPALHRSGMKVAIVGSGPAGLTAAQQLARRGHAVVVFEKVDRIGGLLRYGIPDFKLEKWIIDRRLEQMQKEGVAFESGVDAGTDISVRYMKRTFDAIVITTGATVPRGLDIAGRHLQGIHYAMEFLVQQNKRIAGDAIPSDNDVTAKDKDVVVIGGGDTGADCVGTARRQGAREITQLELLPEPPRERLPYNPWPTWPMVMCTSSCHEEGSQRLWSVLTKEFVGEKNKVKELHCVKLKWSEPDGSSRRQFREVPGSEFKLKADLVLLAMGFIHVEHGPLVQDFDLKRDERGNISVDSGYMTSVPGVFAAGDCVMGASSVVRTIYQGRQIAKEVDQYLSEQDY